MNIIVSKSSTETIAKNTDPVNQIEVFIAGTGAIGSTLIKLIQSYEHARYQIKVAGLCNSRFTFWNPDAAVLERFTVLQKGLKTDWDHILEKLKAHQGKNLVFVDATGNSDVARKYHYLLEKGIHVVTSSKRGLTFEQDYFDQLKKYTSTGTINFRYETAVGAGLPVISTIHTLLNSDDKPTEISGVVSGTMTYLFNQIQKGKLFSETVLQAKELGYTEPDPRDDLSGEDVARKFLILARTCGYPFERDQIKVQSLVPGNLTDIPLDEFLDRLTEADGYWKQLNAKALVNNTALRYVGKFTDSGIEVGVQEVKNESPLGGLQGTDNLIQIYTKRYAESPIVIQGPGAGKEVTAAGILGDIVGGRF